MSYSQPAPNLPSPKPKPKRVNLLPWFIGILFWGLVILWYQYTPSEESIEFFYSRGLYRANVLVFALLQQVTELSLALLIVPGAVLIFLLLWILNWIYIRKKLKKNHFWGFWWGIKWGFILTGFVLMCYLFLWGAGYQRKPIEAKLNLDIQNPTEDEVRVMLNTLLQIINENNVPRDKRDPQLSVQHIAKSMQKLVSEWDEVPIYLPTRVKKTPKGLFLLNSTSGMCVPFTLEPHVDGALPPYSFVATSAHELAHIAGYCGEADASFVGFVSALQSGDPLAKYSCALELYTRLVGFLTGEERKQALDRLPPEAHQDLKEEREVVNKYRIQWVSSVSWKVYDAYLKSQGVKEGVKDYGRAIKLIVAGARKGLVPLLPTEPGSASTSSENLHTGS